MVERDVEDVKDMETELVPGSVVCAFPYLMSVRAHKFGMWITDVGGL